MSEPQKKPFGLQDLENSRLTLTKTGEVRFGAPEGYTHEESKRYIESVKSFLNQHSSSTALRSEWESLFLNLENILKSNPSIADDIAKVFKKKLTTDIFVAAHVQGRQSVVSMDGKNDDVFAFFVRKCGIDINDIKFNNFRHSLDLAPTAVEKLAELGLVDKKFFEKPYNLIHVQERDGNSLAILTIGTSLRQQA